jgi:hypothetical protein
MCLQFGFVIFWQKDFGARAAHKMLVKLTPDILKASDIFSNNRQCCCHGNSLLLAILIKKNFQNKRR